MPRRRASRCCAAQFPSEGMEERVGWGKKRRSGHGNWIVSSTGRCSAITHSEGVLGCSADGHGRLSLNVSHLLAGHSLPRPLLARHLLA